MIGQERSPVFNDAASEWLREAALLAHRDDNPYRVLYIGARRIRLSLRIPMSAKRPGAVWLMTKELAMERVPHELSEEFPAEKHSIEQLTRTSYEFRRLATQYDEVNRHIHRIESEEEPTTDEVLEKLKKERLKLKDDIASQLAKLERRM